MIASVSLSIFGEVQPSISPGDNGLHWGTITLYWSANSLLTDCKRQSNCKDTIRMIIQKLALTLTLCLLITKIVVFYFVLLADYITVTGNEITV